MKALGQVEIGKLVTNEKYRDLFTPLTAEEYEDLKASIAKSGVVVELIVERDNNKLVVLSGHHRLRASKELKLAQVPCNEVESLDEKQTAVFDNVTRRQMDAKMRKHMAEKEKDFLERELKDKLLPDIFELYEAKVMTEQTAKDVAFMSRDKQQGLLRDFREGLKSQGEKSDDKIAEMKVKHEKQMGKLESDLKMAEQSASVYKESLKGKEKTLADKQEEIEELRKIKAKAEKDLRKHLDELEEKKKEAAGTVRKEIEKEMAELLAEQEERSRIINDKNKEIEKLLEEKATFQAQLDHKQGQVNLVQMKMEEVVKQHNDYVEEMSSPAILEVRLNAIVGELETMLKYVIFFRWSDKAVNVASEKVKEIAEKATRLAEYVADNKAKDLRSE